MNSINKLLGYTVDEMCQYENLVSKYIGKFSEVNHEIESKQMHIDVLIIPPSNERSHYILLTMGMGAFCMPIPNYYDDKRNRVEIAMRLPASWKIHSTDIKWTWPVILLRRMAKMPYQESSWFGAYHDIEYARPFSENTQMCAIELDVFDQNLDAFCLKCGSPLKILNAIPIYKSELEYAKRHGGAALLDKMSSETRFGPLNVNRLSVV